MLVKQDPESQISKPIFLGELLSTNSSVYVIESVLQREYVWPYSEIQTLWNDMFSCILKNYGNGMKNFDGSVCYPGEKYFLGNLETSYIEFPNLERLPNLGDCSSYHSIVDGSQRLRSVLFCSIAFQYLKSINCGNEMLNLKLFEHRASRKKTNNIIWKICEFGRCGDGELGKFYKYLLNSSVKKIKSDIDNGFKSLQNRLSSNDKKRDYFDVFSAFVSMIEKSITENGFDDLDQMFEILMKNVFFYNTIIPKENKFNRFVDCNKKGTPMSEASLYPKYIISNYGEDEKEEVQASFDEFSEAANLLETGGSNKHFRPTKNGVHSVQWIMTTVLKNSLVKLSKEDPSIDCAKLNSSTFSLSDIDYGIEKCFQNNLLFDENNVSTAIDYFKECYKMSDFLANSFNHHSDNLSHCYYYLRDMGSANVLWWYFINPSYLTKKYFLDREKETINSFVMDCLFRLYCVYHVRRGAGNTNSQKLIDVLSELSTFLVMCRDEDETSIKNGLINICKSYVTDYEDIYTCVYNLSYNKYGCSTRAIGTVLASIEYSICKELKLCLGSFYDLYNGRGKKDQKYHLDHWYPQKEFDGLTNTDVRDYNQLGNLVILEKGLNVSKGDKTHKNSDIYKQSRYFGTLLLDSSNRANLSNDQLEYIDKMDCLVRFDEKDINSPSLSMIKMRTKKITDYFVNSFLKDFFNQ